MKVRKLAVALALAGGLGSGVAQALGLGEIELQSYLNEPMDAEIVLPQSQGVDPGDVFVNIAPERAYQRLGLERNQFLGKLRFDVTTLANGSLVVNVSSREPLREPYLNFLLELTWPNGRLMREYAVLVDPPVYAEESGVSETVRAPSNAQSRPAPSARSSESVRRQARVEQSSGSGYRSDTFGPTGPSDTLWTIASSVRPDNSLSMQQVMLALQDLNPDAFISNNINRLKRGQVLRVPTAGQIRNRSRAEAIQVVAQQNQEFQNPKRTVDATPAQQPKSGGAGNVSTSGDELKLLVADDKGGRSEAEGGSAGGNGQLAGGVDAGAAVAMEELESARRENDELNTRVNDLQDQVKTLQRLIELKNNQLAEVQQGAAVNDAAAQNAQKTGDSGAAIDTAETATDATNSDAMEPGIEASPAEAASSSVIAENVGTGEKDASEAPSEAEQGGTASSEAEVAESEVESGAQPAAEDAGEQTIQSAQADAPDAKAQPKPASAPAADKGFPGNVIDAITGNTMYQIALGGGLILLLLLLLLLARRSANREKAFYEQLNSDTDGPDDSFDLSLDDGEPEQSPAGDALEEADAYVAYGRYDQAGEVLETAISREPSRTDLRLKLLGVYADNQDRESFEKQFGEVEALNDDEAIAQANELRSRLEEAESIPSIDDLESQLRSGSFVEDSEVSNEFEAEESEQRDSEFSEIDSAFADFDLDASDDVEQSSETDNNTDTGEEEAKDGDDGLIEYDLSGLELPEAEAKSEVPEDVAEEESDFSSLEIDLDEPEADDPLEESLDDSLKFGMDNESTGIDSLDESFLDELDAELDKVAGEDEELGGSEMEESTLDDLELDVSDEDLALMEEFSDSADSANAVFEGDELSLDDELELEDSLREDDLNDDDLEGIESLGDLTEESDEALVDEELPVASDEVRDEAPKSPVPNLDEDDLGDDDDFDFLAGTDEAATKLDLARAYIEMGDSDGARDILEEVALEGDGEQKSEAQDLLKNLS
ncbi:FimV/HubP family polar landmark protein [Marinobacter sp.]|uniref:FimV/HubP family polar landmark protein n=1 Tax=Marinobacter sp. TaxID=50741 RepID=UPI001B63581D|nr:FimV/HubP family polar landmark protein [Marinobacter sp.]MBQ0834504.1 hypothetical protein [Marinobacter sp.]